MKKTRSRNAKKARPHHITRREFVGGALAAGVVAGAPAILRGRNLNDKLDIAFIACGGRANASLSELTITPGRGDARPAEAAAAPTPRQPRPHPDENVVVLCDVNQVALDAASQRFPKAKTFNDLRKVFDNPNDVRRRRRLHRRAHARVRHLPGADPRQARLLREAAHLQHLGGAAHSRDRREVSRSCRRRWATRATRRPRAGRSRKSSMTGVIGPVREVHVWADRAWGLQDAASAEKFDKPHGFYNGIQIVDRFKEEMPIPADQSLRSVARAGTGAAVPRDVLPGAALVSLVGFRQRHDERPRQPRQRRAVHGARTSGSR